MSTYSARYVSSLTESTIPANSTKSVPLVSLDSRYGQWESRKSIDARHELGDEAFGYISLSWARSFHAHTFRFLPSR